MQDPGRPILKKPPGFRDTSSDSGRAKPSTKFPGPKKPVLPPSFYHQKKKSKRRKCCRFCCCCLCISILILILLLACLSGLFYLWFNPKLPIFRLRPVQFNRFNVITSKDRMSYHLSGQANIWLEVKNPNQKITFYYGGTQMTLTSDGDTELGSSSLPGFTQGTGNMTLLRFVTRMDGSQVIDVGTAKRLNSTLRSGALRINVEVKTKVGIGLGEKMKVQNLPVVVSCGGFTMKQLNDDGPPKCSVNVMKWFYIRN